MATDLPGFGHRMKIVADGIVANFGKTIRKVELVADQAIDTRLARWDFA